MIPIKREATILDAVALAGNLRDEDREEIEASNGSDLQATLVSSFMSSTETFVWTLDGKPICMAGVAKSEFPGPLKGAGVPWMLGAPEMVRYSKMLVKDARVYVDKKLDEYPILFNFVHVHNVTSILWLHRLGFRFGQLIPEYGVGKQPFIFFYRNRND